MDDTTKIYVCERCGERFTEGDFINHDVDIDENYPLCPECPDDDDDEPDLETTKCAYCRKPAVFAGEGDPLCEAHLGKHAWYREE